MFRNLTGPALVLALTVSASAQMAKPHFDENALRYYASLGQKDRVEAEARRLQTLDPSWRVPADLWTTRPGRADESPLWTLYAQNRLDDLEGAIAARRAIEPDWTPSDDLVAKVKLRGVRVKILALAQAQGWHELVQSAKRSGLAWAKDDAEVLWLVAEAYARENDCGEAYVIYQSILANHRDASERRATIEHAIALIPMAYVEKLIALGRPDAAGQSEWASIASDITRARISAYLNDAPANDVAIDNLTRFEDEVRASAEPDKQGLIAWYHFKRRDYALALEWFKLAIGHGGDAGIAHGLAHTLHHLGRKREAEEVAYAWRDPLINNSILFTDLLEEDLTKERPPFIEPDRVQRYAQVTIATESGEGAQALGWYAYNTCQYPLALKWFERAVAWLPKEATVFGYALTLQRLKKNAEFRDVVNRYDGLFPKVVALAFDDGKHAPSSSCEAALPTPSRSSTTAGQLIGQDWAGRTMADTLSPDQAAPLKRNVATYARARVPSPDALGAGGSVSTPLTKRTDFPFAVSPANPFRFSALREAMTDEHDGRGREEPGPLVARRVPGVGVMPYERYGFTLLPGWDGTADASSPTAAERQPSVGTLWAAQVSLPNGASTDASARAVDTTSRLGLTKARTVTAPSDRRS